jgi:uncharacterized protein
MFPAIAAIILVIGFANQRGTTCAVRAINALVHDKDFSRLAANGVAASASLLGLAIALASGASPANLSGYALPTVMTVTGGVVAGLGAWLNGRCAMGTIAGLSSGDVPRVATLVGFLGGAIVQTRALSTSFLAFQPSSGPSPFGIALALFVFAACWHFAARSSRAPGWMTVIGMSAAGLAFLRPDWSYTSWFSQIAAMRPSMAALHAATLALLVAGGVLASHLSAEWHIQWGTASVWLRSFAGGALMGIGAALVPGGNDAMLLMGLPLLLPHLSAAYAAFLVTLTVLAKVTTFKALA